MSRGKKIRRRTVFLAVWLLLIVFLTALIIILGPEQRTDESVREAMLDGVLHERNRFAFFGLEVNPGLISAFIVTFLLLFFALIIRLFILPRFKRVPGKLQSVIEWPVEFFDRMAEGNSPHRTRFVGAYIFCVGLYVFFGTLFELLGLQWNTTSGEPFSLPAPLSDINGAIAVGVTSYLVIFFAGLFAKGPKGALGVLKDISLPVSMSFRLFGALLSGLLVTELVYYYVGLSFALPVVVGVLFTLIHALIQTYVLTTLVSTFYGEAVEPSPEKQKNKKAK